MSIKKRVLFLTQEMSPYTDLSEISELLKKLPLYTQDNGMEIRVLMPRFGSINERRHRLHEVVRLSGMNIIIDDDDYPLIIKVASLPGARLQVYFLDNEEFFKRKFMFEDQAVSCLMTTRIGWFLCKGAVETVRSLVGLLTSFIVMVGPSLVPFTSGQLIKMIHFSKKARLSIHSIMKV